MMATTVVIEPLKDALGADVFRVSRIFPNTGSANRASILLAEVTPEAFDPHPTQEAELAAITAESERLDAGEYQAIRQHDAAEGRDESSACIGSVCGVGE